VRRDLAVVVAEAVSVEAVCDLVRVASGDLLKHVTVFDVFRGGSVAEGQKSLALALTLQSAERTLDEPTVNRCITVVIEKLQKELGAVLRD
jgi:phenylalanyl-tRNA synthetase beta chain